MKSPPPLDEILQTRAPSSSRKGEVAAAGAEFGTASTELARVFTDNADHEIVQRRLGLLYGVLGTLVLAIYVIGIFGVAATMPAQFWSIHLSWWKTAHLLLGILLLVAARTCTRGKLVSRAALTALDILGSFFVMCLVSALVLAMPDGTIGEVLHLIPLMMIICLRAALVPSPPRYTAFVAAVASIPGPFAAYHVATTTTNVVFPPTMVVVFVSAWTLAGIFAAFVIAKVVYGLRAEVKKATKLGQYTLQQKIGEGGMGVVYRARHALLRRPTAIKLLATDRADQAHDIKRFEREVQLTSMLTHPNTVAVYDFGHTHDGIFYYAMEYLDGMSLHDLVERDGPQPPARVIHILLQIAGALAEAHGVGLVHRDVKPANVFLCERGGLPDFVKVLDFGLVKHTGAGPNADVALSHANAIAGTPHYMAPESITDPGSVDARVDIYALGCVGYFLLTGTTVFEGNNLVEICSHHLHTPVEAPHVRLLRASSESASLDALLTKCLAKKRDERIASAAELTTMLRACESGCGWDLNAAAIWWAREKTATLDRNGSSNSAGEPKNRAPAGGQKGAKKPAQV